MHNIWLIGRREFIERVRTRAFILSTILIPIILGCMLAADVLMVARTKIESQIAIVTEDRPLALALQRELDAGSHSRIKAEMVSQPTAETRRLLDARLSGGSLDGYLWIMPAAAADARASFQYTRRSSLDLGTSATIGEALRAALLRIQFHALGVNAGRIDVLMQPIEVASTQIGKPREAIASYISVAVFFFLMYIVILLYGMNVARSVVEEKSSRIFEVLLTSIRPEELLAGKILGVGSVGLTQVVVWLAAAAVVAAGSGMLHAEGIARLTVNPAQTGFFVLYFLLGYLLYSTVAAAIGAMTNTEQELQQLSLFLLMPLLFCMIIVVPVVLNPSGALAVIVSLIPFCAPLIMYLRICLFRPPVWQLALSVVLLLVTNYAVLMVATRIYRVGILMYGKKPTLPEIFRWLKYS